jgi:TPR repeat protein
LNFVFRKLSKPFNDGFKPLPPSFEVSEEQPGDTKGSRSLELRQGIEMARFEMLEQGFGVMGASAQADILFELGMMYATGRDCDADIVAAHKWFNIAAIKGSARAAELRSELSATMSKVDIARALREAREWMTMH